MEASISSMEGSRCALLAVAIVTSAAPAHDPENRSSIFEEDQAQIKILQRPLRIHRTRGAVVTRSWIPVRQSRIRIMATA
ncbi:hypothetical protein NKH64_16750 [Mesorhizobium sp. M0999]|uniref:hypothetical protein n=1 Tax=unclassified Mesorhizobium TaxID=325217 RepID=UPI0018CB0CE0|nr:MULTISPECIES: hypothetical protein [unclassified Mesorhizobium]